MQQLKQYGVTPPISLNVPEERDLEMSRELEVELHKSGFFESEEDGVQRERVLGRLNTLIQSFVRQVAIDKGILQNDHNFNAEEEVPSGKIYTFGSYRLGVHSKGADIDTLCVAPQHVDRSDFFSIFYSMLQAETDVTQLTAIPEAYVPVIKMDFAGVKIDLVFARLSMRTIPEDLDLLDTSLLRRLDEKCILSLNGSRTTDEILRLVPNVETFHAALRCIKLWAKQRGIYSNAMGYVAGVALALLTARVCQLYPNAAPSTVIARLFSIYAQWPWPQPVCLKAVDDLPLQMKVWNPRVHVADRFHRMPLITPAYPSMCATHNVTASTLRLMTEEFRRGAELMARIEAKRATWADLLASTDFFARHRTFFQVIGVSRSLENHLVWSGFLGSKVRHLTPKLEMEECISAAPPYHEGFELIVRGQSLEDVKKAHQYCETGDSGSKKLSSTKNYMCGDGGLVKDQQEFSPSSSLETSPIMNDSTVKVEEIKKTVITILNEKQSSNVLKLEDVKLEKNHLEKIESKIDEKEYLDPENSTSDSPKFDDSKLDGNLSKNTETENGKKLECAEVHKSDDLVGKEDRNEDDLIEYHTIAFYVALVVAPPGPGDVTKGPRRVCLDGPVNDFKAFVGAYEKITPDMQIIVRDMKRDALPDYVFEGGVRPPRRTAGLGRRALSPPKNLTTCPIEGSLSDGKRSKTSLLDVPFVE